MDCMLGYKSYSLGEYTKTHQDFAMLVVEIVAMLDVSRSKSVSAIEYNQMQDDLLINLRLLIGLRKTSIRQEIDSIMDILLGEYSKEQTLLFISQNLGLFYL